MKSTYTTKNYRFEWGNRRPQQKKLYKNIRLILTTKSWDLTDARLITIVLHPDLFFNICGWELELSETNGQSRQVLDIEKITTQLLKKSNYYCGFIYVCGDNMDSVIDFSSRFDVSALKYFSITSKYKGNYELGWSWQ